MKYKYKVNGLDCANCTQKLEDALNKKEEINDCVISFATGMMTFESNQGINDNELLSFIQSIEDEVTIDNLSTNKTHHYDECSCGHHHEHKHHHHDECGCGHHHEHEHHEDDEEKIDHVLHMEHISTVTITALLLHNMIEGMALYGVASNNIKSGLLMLLGIGLHNLPFGFQIGSFGKNKENRGLICLLVLSGFIGGLLFSIFGSFNYLVEAIILSLTIGMLLHILIFELLKEIIQEIHKKETIYGIIIGIIILIIINLI